MITTTLPMALEAENSLLASILEDKNIFFKVAPYVNKDVFFSLENKLLWVKLSDMIHLNKHVDLVTVCSSLTEVEKKDGLTSFYITGLLGLSVGNELAIVYAREVYEKYLLRMVISKGNDMQELAISNTQDAYGVLSETQGIISELLNLNPGKQFNIGSQLLDTMQSIKESGNNLIKFGIEGLDGLSGGMTRGEITIVGGRPGHGKTTMIVNLVKNLMDSGKKVMLINREMTNIEMLKKIIALESGNLSYRMLRQGVHDPASLEELRLTMARIEDKYNSEKFAMFDDFRDFASSSAEVKKFKPDVIIDDYIQLIQPANPLEQRRLQLETIVNGYKWLAKSTNACAILVSQLNRGIESRGSGKPMLSDLAESGAIEQVAENVLFVYYDYKINYAKSKTGPNCIEVIGSKVRYGVSGATKLGYNGDRVRLYNSIDEYRKTRG